MQLCHTLLLIAPHCLIKNVSTLCLSNLSKLCLTHFSSLVSCHSLPCPMFLSPQHTMAFMLTLFPISEIPVQPLSICQNSTHFKTQLKYHFMSFLLIFPVYLSRPEYSLLSLNSHSTLSLYHSTRYILLCLSSLLDSGFFIFMFTTNSTVPGMNNWNREKRREYKGHVLPFHVKYDSQWDDKQPSIPTNYPNDPKERESVTARNGICCLTRQFMKSLVNCRILIIMHLFYNNASAKLVL